jgi:hypothetical protein
MTRDDVTRMAREAGWSDDLLNVSFTAPLLERFAALVAAAEREACAKVCESLFDMDDDSCNEAEQCAAAIRARNANGS